MDASVYHSSDGGATGFINRANAYAARGQRKEALDDFAKAAALNPQLPELYLHRAVFFSALHRPVDALADLERCAQLKPDLPAIFFLKGNALRALGKYSAADEAYQRGLALRPEPDFAILNDIAWFYATCPDPHFRRPAQAISLACRACDLTHWRMAAERDTLAAAYAAAAQFRDAINNERSALTSGSLNQSHREEMEKRLGLYEQKRPYVAQGY